MTSSVDDDLTGSSSEDYAEEQQQVTAEQIQFVFDTMKKEAPYDVTSITQLFYGMASAFTKTPIHHKSTNERGRFNISR